MIVSEKDLPIRFYVFSPIFEFAHGKAHAVPRFNLPRRLREILLRVCGDDELALSLYVVEIPANLGDVIRGLPVVLPAGGCLSAFAASITLVHGKIRRAAVADALRHFEDHVRARVRLADHIEHVCLRRVHQRIVPELLQLYHAVEHGSCLVVRRAVALERSAQQTAGILAKTQQNFRQSKAAAASLGCSRCFCIQSR